jgi:putative endonuclease
MLGWVYRLCDRARHRARVKRWAPDLAAGRHAEDLAHRYLQKLGMTIVARNYRTTGGWAEVDLVAWDGPTLVFVEVKSRASDVHGAPDRAIDDVKQRKIAAAANDYRRRIGLESHPVRFDVIAVVLGQPATITHFPDAFRAL